MAPSLMENVTFALLESLGDRDDAVRETVFTSLRTIGMHQPAVLLSTAHMFLARHSKLTSTHRGYVLSLMEKICETSLKQLSSSLISLVINLATQEMTFSKDVQEEWQAPACSLLVTLGRHACNDVMESLLQKFQPGFNPHCYILTTLGDLAAANSFGFVPFLSDILSRTVPTLNNVKADPLKFAFSNAIKRYAESLCHYVDNIDQAPDASVQKEIYASQFAAVYDVLFTQWLQVRDQRTRGAVIETLGTLCHCFSAEKMRDEVKRLAPTVISMYKKQTDSLPVTLSLCRLLEVSVIDETNPLEPFLEDVWVALFPQVYMDQQVDTTKPTMIKNQTEALRCYQVTVVRYADKLFYYLVQKLQSATERTRITALLILRHLVNSSGPYIDDKKALIMIALKPVLNDNSNRVKKYLCQLTLAMADHGYLSAEGGNQLIEFLVKQLALPEDAGRKSAELDVVSNTALRHQCAHALYTMATNVQQVEHVLWPYLFEFLCVDSYTGAMADLCRCLTPIAQRMNVGNRLTIVYGISNDRLPGSHQILARLITFAGIAGPKSQRTANVLQLMKEMAPFFFPSLRELWSHQIISLLNALDDCKPDSELLWEENVIQFLSSTIDAVGDEDWSCALAAALGKQLLLCNSYLEEKRFLFMATGEVLAHIKNLQFVVDHLDLLLKSVSHANALERNGCANGLGLCSRTHTDIVLTKLENTTKLEYQKKASGGFFGFIKDSIPMKTESDIEIINMKATLLLAYGYVAKKCPVEQLTQKLEATIMRFLLPYFESAKEVILRQSLLQTTNLIAQAVHPSHLKKEYSFAYRPQLLNFIKDYVKAENEETMTSNVRILAMTAAGSLAKLSPALAENDVWSLGTVCALATYSLRCSRDETNGETENTVDSAILALNNLLEELLLQDRSVERLAILMKLLYPWFSSDNPTGRERSIDSSLTLLTTYFNVMNQVPGKVVDFPYLGGLFGRFCPRCCDSVATIRQKSLDCVRLLLAISNTHAGLHRGYGDQASRCVSDFIKDLERPDLQSHLLVVDYLAQVVDEKLPTNQIQNYLTVLFDLILDKQSSVSTAASVLLRHALAAKGSILVAEGEKIVTMILARLSELVSVQTYAECLQSLQVFSRHHQLLVASCLLGQQIPYSQCVCDCWQTVGRDRTMLPQLLNYLLDILRNEAPHETVEGCQQKFARFNLLSAIAAISEVVRSGEPEETIMDFFPRLLVGLLVQIGVHSETVFPRSSKISADYYRSNTPCSLVSGALKVLLHRTRSEAILVALNERRNWQDFEDPFHYADAVAELGKSVAEHSSHMIRSLVDLLCQYHNHKTDGARVVMASMLAAFLKHCQSQSEDLIDAMVGTLMSGLADTNITVRKLSVRGMGNVAHCTDAVLSKYIPSVLSSMIAGLEDNLDHKDEVALEAMQGLGKLVARVPREAIERIFVNILLRIRPCFEKESGAVRAVAFTLFGHLARFGESDVYLEQIHSNIVPLLLHAHDEVSEVSEACCFALSAIAPLIKADGVKDALKRHQSAEKLASYAEFLNEVTKGLAMAYGDRLNFYALCCANYFKSASFRIRANAALFTGYLLGAVPADTRSTISKDLIFNGLTVLLKEPEPEVRLAAADSMSYLHSY